MNAQDLQHDLQQFTGTEHWYSHPLGKQLMYTDGVKFFADQQGAYWLIDIFASQPEILATMRDGFAVMELVVKPDSTGQITCSDGNDNITYTRDLDFTDALEGTWRFFLANNVIMLPSEY